VYGALWTTSQVVIHHRPLSIALAKVLLMRTSMQVLDKVHPGYIGKGVFNSAPERPAT